MGQAPKGTSYNTAGDGYALIAGAGDFGALTPEPSKYTDAPTKLSQPGDLILCIRATIGDRNWSDKKYCLGRGVAGLKARKEKLNQTYLWHWIEHAAPALKAKGRGATFLQVSKSDIGSLQIPLPPLEEQKRIAAILDAADDLRAKRRESLAQLDALLQSTFLDMFGDPVANPMGWEVVLLENLGTLDRGVSRHRPRNDPSLLGGSHPLIQTGEVAKSRGYIRSYSSTYSDLGLSQSKMWPAGTLCITIAANIASTGILTFDACFPDSVVGFTPSENSSVEYVQVLFGFLKAILERQAPQVAQKNINLKVLRELPVPMPPSVLQRRFAAIVDSVEQQKAKQCAHLEELDTLFASLQFRAFKGEL